MTNAWKRVADRTSECLEIDFLTVLKGLKDRNEDKKGQKVGEKKDAGKTIVAPQIADAGIWSLEAESKVLCFPG